MRAGREPVSTIATASRATVYRVLPRAVAVSPLARQQESLNPHSGWSMMDLEIADSRSVTVSNRARCGRVLPRVVHTAGLVVAVGLLAVANGGSAFAQPPGD